MRVLFSIAMMSVLGLSLVSLGACNTVEGMGRDLESAGRSVQKL